ncbi:MAG: DUF805 domain-containing protein [Pseudomonadota bacterium]
MTIWDYFKHTVANAGNGSGRASRSEYALMFCVLLVVMFCPWLLSEMIASEPDALWRRYLTAITLAVAFSAYVPLLCLASRRCHDLGWPGWWGIINPWPLLLVLPGQPQTNLYGPPPKSENGHYSSAKERTLMSAVRDGLNSFYWLS